jgi:hypothetical protein
MYDGSHRLKPLSQLTDHEHNYICLTGGLTLVIHARGVSLSVYEQIRIQQKKNHVI